MPAINQSVIYSRALHAREILTDTLERGKQLRVTASASSSALVQRFAGGVQIDTTAIAAGATVRFGEYHDDIAVRASCLIGTVTVEKVAKYAQVSPVVTDPVTGAVSLVDGDGNVVPFTPLRSTPVRCATFGDSTANVSIGNTDNGILDAVFPGSGPTVISYELSKWAVYGQYPQAKMVANGGISGETTTQMLARDNAAASATRKSIQDVIDLRPDVVFLRCGSINNLTPITPATYSAVVALAYAEHIAIFNRFRSAGIPTIDCGLYGYSGSMATWPDTVRQALVQLNAMFAAYYLAQNSRTAVFITPSLSSADGNMLAGVSAPADGIHLNNYGSIVLARAEARALEAMFGPSAGPRFPGVNLIANALFSATGATGYGIAPTGFSAIPTNATLANGKLEEVDGKMYWTVEVTPTTSAPGITLYVPFTPTTYGIVANDVFGYELDLLITDIAGTGAPPDVTGYYTRNDIYKTAAGRLVPSETVTAFGGFPGPHKAHVAFAYRCQEASAALSASSSAPVLFTTGSLTPFKIGISSPRLVKLLADTPNY